MRRKMAIRPTDRPMKKAIRPGMTRPKRRPNFAALGKKGIAGGIAALKNQAAATAKAKPGAKRPKAPARPPGRRPTARPRPRPARRPIRRR